MTRNELENRRVPYFGNYVLFHEIGRGGMGVVYDAQQASLDRPVALKILHRDFAAAETAVQRLRIEAEAAARLDHPNIVPIYEVGEHEGQPYLAMQLIEGESLAESLARPGTRMSDNEAARLLGKVSRAVHHAHQRGVLHRDLKPGNILLDEKGEPHLIDFGLAKRLEQDLGITRTGAFLGTPAFASPEQAAGNSRSVTTATDIYSLGAILYAVLTGQPPFGGQTAAETIEQVRTTLPPPPRSLRPGLTRDLETICLKCLEKEPARRYASALDVAEDLERFLARRPIAARPVGTLERCWMWVRRKPAQAALWFAGITAALTILAGLWLWLEAQAARRESQALQELSSARTERLLDSPRTMSWRGRAEEHVSAATLLADKQLYRDEVASLCEGLDGTPAGSHPAHLNQQLVFAEDGAALLLAGATNAEIWFLQAQTNPAASRMWAFRGQLAALPHDAPLQVLQPDGGAGLVVWMAAEERALCQLQLPEGLALPAQNDRLCAISRQTNLLALILTNRHGGPVLAFWSLPMGRVLNTLPIANLPARPGQSLGGPLAVSPDGSLAALGDPAGEIRVWEVASGKPRDHFALSTLPVSSLAFAANPRRAIGQSAQAPGWLLAAGDEGGSVGVWDLTTRRIQALCREGYYQVYALAFSPDGATLASGGRDVVRLWDAATGALLLNLPGDYCGILAFSRDGTRLAANLSQRQVQVWELHDGLGIATMRGLSGGPRKIVFSPQRNLLAAVNTTWEVGVWDLETGRLLHLLPAPRGFTADNCALAFSPDGTRLACSAGEEAVLWDLATGTPIPPSPWKLPGGLSDAITFPARDALYLLRTETVQGTEWPFTENSWEIYPRVCRLRNLLGSKPLEPISTLSNFNRHVFSVGASGDGQFFAIEGINSVNGVDSRGILAIGTSTGARVWRIDSSNRLRWAGLPFASSGACFAYTTNGSAWGTRDLLTDGSPFVPFPSPPHALGPGGALCVPLHGILGENYLDNRGVAEIWLHDKPRGDGVVFSRVFL